MNDNLSFIELFDIYGSLLTEKQRKTFKLYYLDDLSLREIAENSKITFQAVRYSLEVTKNILLNFEEVIHMNEYKKSIKLISDIYLKENNKNKEIVKILNKLK
ncbi:MAG: sigma factor-like helix-turn-helix DNA-binding protein [Clostridia bacterium]